MENINELKAMYQEATGTTGKRPNSVLLERIKREIKKGKDFYAVSSMPPDRQTFLESKGFIVNKGKVIQNRQQYIITGWTD
jgi:hypothetical protein